MHQGVKHYGVRRILWVFLPVIGLLLGGATSAVAGPFADANSSQVDYQKAVAGPSMRCRDLMSLTTTTFTVLSADMIGDVCRIRGVIPSEIRFEVSLPSAWNGRMMMTGNGGLAGQPLNDVRYQQVRSRIVDHGFAVAFTDTGHDNRVEPGATFAFNSLHKLIDYGYRGIHLTSQTARQLINRYYAAPPAHSYFMGCSNGGRQALMAAQRFPEDFDGILAGAPANDFTGLKLSQAHRMQALKDQPLDLEEVAVLASYIYQQCDALDGQRDGLIDDPRACHFDPASDLPRCDGGDQADCFTTAEIESLEHYYSPTQVAGVQVYPAHPVGSEVAGPNYGGKIMSGWVPWVINPQGRPLLDVLGSDFFRYIIFLHDDPDYDWTTFDFNEMPDNIEEARAILDATDPDLSAFQAAGGKLLSYFGWSDPDVNPLTAIAYRDAVASTLKQEVTDFYQLFMVPGMFHCSGGPGASDFDAITPLINWVEAGIMPARIEAQHLGANATGFSRPLCAYPAVARPIADGDRASSLSYECQTPTASQ